MKFICCLGWSVVLVFGGTVAARAQGTVFSNANWLIEGAVDTGPNPSAISVVVDRGTPVAVSQLNISYNLGGTNFVPVYVVTGSGTLQPLLPGSDPGGTYQIGSYYDCDDGFLGPMAITTLDISTRANRDRKDRLKLTGSMSNNNSMQCKNLSLTLFPAQTNRVRLDVAGALSATRKFCVADTGRGADRFRVVTVNSNYISPDQHTSDTVRFTRIAERICFGFYGCYVHTKSVCAAVTNATGYLFDNPGRLGKPQLLVAHTDQNSGSAPDLAVTFNSPIKGNISPEGYLTATNDVTVDNLQVWGDLAMVHKNYHNRKKVLRLRVTLLATPPKAVTCDEYQ